LPTRPLPETDQLDEHLSRLLEDVRAEGDRFVRFRRWWAAGFVVLVTIVAGHVLLTTNTGVPAKIGVAVASAGLLVWRFTVGNRINDVERPLLTIWYVAGLSVFFAVAVASNPSALYFFFALNPEAVAVFHRFRPAIITCCVFSAIGLIAQLNWLGYIDHGGLPVGALSVLSITAGLALTFFYAFVATEARRRAELLAALQASRQELRRLHREAGAHSERERLSHEIHDTIAQGLSSIVMLLDGAEAVIEEPGASPKPLRKYLQQAQLTARENLEETRSLVAGLRPSVLAAGSLPEALERVVQRAGENGGFTASMRCYGTARPLPASVDVVLVRIAQESLSNATRHATAERVDVELHFEDNEVRLLVRDDGKGFYPDLVSSGFGLVGMRERAAELGGRVWITSEPGTGTTVEAVVG
jgi:signal transduction histidine kinase